MSEGYREFYDDFNTDTHVKDVDVSVDKRPDSVSYNYLTAFTIGPIDIGDSSAGATNRTWKVYTDGWKVYYQRENLLHDGYEPAVLLFQFPTTEQPIVEIDAAFDQNARIFICAQRLTGVADAPEVWFYWFDPFAASFLFTNFGEGRTPKCLLDDLVSIFESDILVFYTKDSTGILNYRQQRDRYQIEYATPFTTDLLHTVEDTARTRGNRIVILLAVRDPVTGRYSLKRHESTLYPYLMDPEPLDLSPLLTAGGNDEIVILHTLYDIDVISFSSLSAVTGILEDTTPATPTNLPNEDWKVRITILAGDTFLAVISHDLYDKDTLDFAPFSLQSGSCAIIVIVHDVYDKDTISFDGFAAIAGDLS